MIVAALPIEPRDGDRCWAFHVFNDEREPYDSIVVTQVSYEWGDFGNSAKIDRRLGPLAPGQSVEVHRETDTEVRTGIVVFVRVGDRERGVYAEVGRLYAPPRGVEHIPVFGRAGKLAELDEL